MSTFTPDTEINDYITIHTIEKTGSVTSAEIEYSIDIGGDTNYGSVDLCDEEFEVQVTFDVSDVEELSIEGIDNLLSALVKYHPEHMSKRLFASAPTDADAIKTLMERLDEINGKHAVIGAELGAIRRAGGMLTVAGPDTNSIQNK